jgi:hypothetical protein
MNNYDKALQSLQPDIKDIARTFLLDKNFADKESNRAMTISFTLSDDRKLGYRRLRLVTYNYSDHIPLISYDEDLVPYGPKPMPLIPPSSDTRQTVENVLGLIDSTPILHIISIRMNRTYQEFDTVYDWHDVSDLAVRAARDPTLNIGHK